MGQLVMRWDKNRTPECPDAPDWGEFTCRPFDGSDRDIDMWYHYRQSGTLHRLRRMCAELFARRTRLH